MKLYHVNRTRHIKVWTKIEFQKDFYTEITDNEYFKDGLSSHGLRYHLQDVANMENEIDAIFEYERRINFPNKISKNTI